MAPAARSSVIWSIGLIGSFYLMTLVLGFGAAALLDTGHAARCERSRKRCFSACLPGSRWERGTLGGVRAACRDRRDRVRHHSRGRRRYHTRLIGIGGARSVRLTFSKRRQATEQQEWPSPGSPPWASGRSPSCWPSRLAVEDRLPGRAGVRGGGIGQPAGAALQPVLRRFNTMGDVQHLRRAALRGRPGLVLPGCLGTPTSLAPDADFAWFPLRNPGIVSIPFGFLCGIPGTLISKDASSQDRYNELEVRAPDAGAEKRRRTNCTLGRYRDHPRRNRPHLRRLRCSRQTRPRSSGDLGIDRARTSCFVGPKGVGQGNRRAGPRRAHVRGGAGRAAPAGGLRRRPAARAGLARRTRRPRRLRPCAREPRSRPPGIRSTYWSGCPPGLRPRPSRRRPPRWSSAWSWSALPSTRAAGTPSRCWPSFSSPTPTRRPLCSPSCCPTGRTPARSASCAGSACRSGCLWSRCSARCPPSSTIVHGDHDQLTTYAYAASLADRFGGQLRVAPDGPHSWPTHDPEGFLRLIDDLVPLQLRPSKGDDPLEPPNTCR